MERKVNILFLVSKFDIGGVQKVNVSMLNNIDKDRFNVHVIYIKDGVLKQDINELNIKIVKIGDLLKFKSLVNITYLCKIIKYIKQNYIDVVHSIDPILYMIGSIAAHFTKIKHIRSQPNLIRTHEKLNTKTLKILPFERWTDKYITFNNSTREDLHLAGVSLEKIQTIYSYIKSETDMNEINYCDIRKLLKISRNTKIVCSIGRLVKGKGLKIFIKMIPFIVQKYTDVVFLIVGDGPLMEQLNQMCKEFEVEEYVRFMGFRNDIPNIVHQITLGVYATAMSAGMIEVPMGNKILISRQSDIMGEYIINGETGILVNNDDPKAYADIILRMLNDEDLIKEMEIKIRNFYKSRFDGDKNMRIFEDLVFELIKD